MLSSVKEDPGLPPDTPPSKIVKTDPEYLPTPKQPLHDIDKVVQGPTTPAAFLPRKSSAIESPFAAHYQRLKRGSISYYNDVRTVVSDSKIPLSTKLRTIAPLRMWISLLFLLILLITLLIYIIVFETKQINTYAETISHLPTSPSPTSPSRKNIKLGLIVLSVGALTSGVNGYFMYKVQKQQAAAALAAAAEIAEKSATVQARGFLQRRMPWIAAIMPDNYHEIFLYVLNFLMVMQGFRVWQNWKHSPASAMIRKWQASKIAQLLRKRDLRRIQRRAAMELAKVNTAQAAVAAAGGGAVGAAIEGKGKSAFVSFVGRGGGGVVKGFRGVALIAAKRIKSIFVSAVITLAGIVVGGRDAGGGGIF